EQVLADPAVTEVMVNGPDEVYVERGGWIEPTEIRFESDGALRDAIERILAPLGRRVDELSPMVDARLADGSRVNVVIPPLAVDGPAHATGPDRDRRGARPRGPRSADRAQHGTRRGAVDPARELARRCVTPPRDAGADGRRRASARSDPRAGEARHRARCAPGQIA